MKINEYMNDGANQQSQAVLAYLRNRTIEDSWNAEYHKYNAEPDVARWENCREQGYVAMLKVGSNQLNIGQICCHYSKFGTYLLGLREVKLAA